MSTVMYLRSGPKNWALSSETDKELFNESNNKGSDHAHNHCHTSTNLLH